MIDFSKRSYEKELLDGNNIPFEDIKVTMKELEVINSYLGGHAITLQGFKKLLSTRRSISVCEIGCGGGDNLKAIYRWAAKNNINVKCTGIDINPECIVYAKANCKGMNIHFIVSDYKYAMFEEKPDIIFSSLFCHHFTDDELASMLKWVKGNSRIGFFINDLHRHPIAYYLIKAITRLFSRSYLVKNDAPISVMRGFARKEWENIFEKAGVTNYTTEWKWAFRHLIISSHE
jgi:2-polyprenyl-3-methyl-5-hydroxy-6-metoxy-1,4-benzoquinol methylase